MQPECITEQDFLVLMASFLTGIHIQDRIWLQHYHMKWVIILNLTIPINTQTGANAERKQLTEIEHGRL